VKLARVLDDLGLGAEVEPHYYVGKKALNRRGQVKGLGCAVPEKVMVIIADQSKT
jgi:hypothetical protein